jgi:hypothetical protein
MRTRPAPPSFAIAQTAIGSTYMLTRGVRNAAVASSIRKLTMDIQLLLRIDRMAQPRLLSLQADFAGARRLADDGLIEVSHQMRFTEAKVGLHALLVQAITEKGRLTIAHERARSSAGGSNV